MWQEKITKMSKTNSFEKQTKVFFHHQQVCATIGCVLDELRSRARDHDVDKLFTPNPWRHKLDARHHFLQRMQNGNLEDYNVIDFVETVCDAVATAYHKYDRHLVLPITKELQDNDMFCTFIYNSIWAVIQATYPDDTMEQWSIELYVPEDVIDHINTDLM